MDTKGITGSFNVNSFNKIVNTTVPDDKSQVLQWLSSLEPQRRHQHLRESRHKGMGKWIFQTSEFQRWNTRECGSSHSVLFCHGDPGVGKTHLSSLVIDNFYGSEQDITVSGLYCDYLDRKEQTTSNILGAMLKQLMGSGIIPDDIRRAFEDAKRHFGGVRPEVPELLKMLKTAIGQRRRVVICIDGLDESLAAHRTGLLSALQAIAQELPNVRLFLTGRPFIRSEVERYFPSVDTILVSPTREDTEAFLRMKLDGDPEPDAMDDHLRADIMEIIPKTISEIFLLVSLSIETILGETTIRRRREKLKQMLKGQNVGDVYTATLERIRAQGEGRARLGMEAIMWIAYSERPLEPDELCQALGVEIGSTDLDNDNTPSIRTILNCGLGLVTVDSSSSKARLVHFTLQEHIIANPTLFRTPHSMIAEVCLTYLNFRCIRDLSPTLRPLPPATPFLEYASHYWGAHARRQTSTSVISLALNLLDGFDAHISCELLLRRHFRRLGDRGWESIYDGPLDCTVLHTGAFLGALELMASLLKIDKWDLNATDCLGRTALMWATKMGHDAIVKMLLEQEDVDPHIIGHDGRTLLSCAARNGHEGIVKMLLERNDVNPDAADKSGRTPLSIAAEHGREKIVRTLLERNDVNPNNADRGGRTPLAWAAGTAIISQDTEEGHERVVKILLERNDVNPDSANTSGRTPLSLAAERGFAGVLRMLLERNDVNPDMADKNGRTPLSHAAGPEYWFLDAGRGGEEVVRILLERNDINPDSVDTSGRTPLSWAAERGFVGILRMLLERNDVNPDRVDKNSRTPLSRAVGPGIWSQRVDNRCERAVRILLERTDVNPDSADTSGRTPLSLAAEGGFAGVLRMLLERNDVNPDRADKSGRTPLSWAVGPRVLSQGVDNRCERAVRMLLERNDVNPDSSDTSGRTPLSLAAEGGLAGVLRMLLQRNDVNPNMADKSGRTPLSWAAGPRTRAPGVGGEWEGAVKILLERNNVIPDSADTGGRTPLSWAASNGSAEVLRMLLERNDVNPDGTDMSGRTPLSWAAGSKNIPLGTNEGREGVVKMLLERNNVNPDSADTSGRTPLSWAASNGSAGVLRMLLERNDVNPDRADKSGRVPLAWVSVNEREETEVMLPLLQRNDIHPNTAEESGDGYISMVVAGCVAIALYLYIV